MSGTATFEASVDVSPNSRNLSVPGPWELPTAMTVSTMSTVGTLITHCLLRRMSEKLWFWSQMKQPTRAGEKPSIMCQPRVMTFCSPLWADVTSTTGPGSRNRRIFVSGKFFFLYVLIGVHGAARLSSLCRFTCLSGFGYPRKRAALTIPVGRPHSDRRFRIPPPDKADGMESSIYRMRQRDVLTV